MEERVVVGRQASQRELKGYSKTTEVWIPVLQAGMVMLAVDVVAGLAVMGVIALGPLAWRVILGLVIMGLAVGLAFGGDKNQPEAFWRRVGLWIFVGGLALAGQQRLMGAELVEVWPEELLVWPGLLLAWGYTFWLGPLVGFGLLIYRFTHELRDPFANRPDVGAPVSEQPGVVYRDRPVYVNRWNGREREREEVIAPVPTPAPVQYSLVDDLRSFILEAHARGLERSNWLKAGQDRIRLWPSGRRVTRGYYDKLVGILRDAGILCWDGSGASAEWECSLDEALGSLDGRQSRAVEK